MGVAAVPLFLGEDERAGAARAAAVSTGREGLERARSQLYDLLLLDVMLPDLGGFELAGELRGETAVVFLSARTSAADLARGRAAGPIEDVVKPFDPVQLATRLHEGLDELGRGGADDVRELRFGPPGER